MSQHKFKILSVDGGGIKGIIPCTILAHIEKETGKKIFRLFDMLAGTSTGGIIVLGLTKPNGHQVAFTAADMLNLYIEEGNHIFSKRPKDFISWVGSIIENGLFDKNYDVESFEGILEKKFGDARLTDCLTDALVTTYALQEEKPFYFSTRLARENQKENILLREIARSTSAAPTYFRPSRITLEKNKKIALVDGGVFANNPAILAYSEAKEVWKKRNRTIQVTLAESFDPSKKTFEAVVEPDDNDLPFFLLSIGCGHSPTSIDFEDADNWRANSWIKPLLTNVFMQSVSESTDYTMRYLLPPFENGIPRYMRLDLNIPQENSEMDDTSEKNINALRKIADEFVETNESKLDEIRRILLS